MAKFLKVFPAPEPNMEFLKVSVFLLFFLLISLPVFSFSFFVSFYANPYKSFTNASKSLQILHKSLQITVPDKSIQILYKA